MRVLQIVGGVSLLVNTVWFWGLESLLHVKRSLRAGARTRMERSRYVGRTVSMERLRRISNSFNHSTGAGGPSGSLGWYVDSATSRKERAMEKETILIRKLGIVFRSAVQRLWTRTLRMFVYIVRHDPAVVIGLVLVGTASTLFFHVTLKLSQVGSRLIVAVQAPLVASRATGLFQGNTPKCAESTVGLRGLLYCLWPCLVGGCGASY